MNETTENTDKVEASVLQTVVADDAATNERLEKNAQADDEDEPAEEIKTVLSLSERRNLSLLVLAYAFLMSSTTMVVGTSAVAVISVGGSTDASPISLACFFVGSACVSYITAGLFSGYGRKIGFLVGNAIGILGAGLGGIAVWISSPTLLILSYVPLGAANGIGLYLRFAAVEVVPPHSKAFAVTLVLSGGVLAAFVGPESAAGTRDIFGDDLLYLGVFMMIAVWNLLMGLCVLFASLPAVTAPKKNNLKSSSSSRDANDVSLFSLIWTVSFWVPVSLAALSWGIMAMPMSIVRVAMGEVGFTQRQSLLAIELHFLGMFAPGFVSGKVIQRWGGLVASAVAAGFFTLTVATNHFCSGEEDGTIATWILGLVFVGIGWNFGFAAATVLLTSVYVDTPEHKVKIQAANDLIMFFIAGGIIVSTGYIYEGGGGELDGWRTVNWTVLGLTGVFIAIVAGEFLRQGRRKQHQQESPEPASYVGGDIEDGSEE